MDRLARDGLATIHIKACGEPRSATPKSPLRYIVTILLQRANHHQRKHRSPSKRDRSVGDVVSHDWLGVSILMRRRTSIWLAVAFLLTAASASVAEVSEFDRFSLWNECRPMELVVEGLSDDATDIGLTRDAIEVAVRSRLRAAHIYSEDYAETEFSDLYVNVTVVGRAFSTNIDYRKVVLDQATMLNYLAPTWSLGGTGTHGQDSNFILSYVTQNTDAFLDEYLRVNDDACE